MSTQVQDKPYTITTMVSTYWDRLKPSIDAKGWGVQQLADALGVSYQAVVKVRDGGAFGSKNNIKAAALFGLNPTWLATGSGPMHLEDQESTQHPVKRSSMRPIWVVGRGAGGVMPERIWTDGDHPVGATDEYADLASSDDHAFLAEVVGQSMFPKYENKNFALVEPGTPIDIEDVVLVRLTDGSTMIKRLLSRRNGSYTLGSFNEPDLLVYEESQVSWMYYCAHEVPRKRIKSRY